MSITIRKAAKIRNTLSSMLEQTRQKLNQTNVALSIYEPDLPGARYTFSNAYTATLKRYTAISDALLEIRQAIDAANHKFGVSATLGEQAMYKGKQYVYAQIIALPEQESSLILASRAKGLVERITIDTGYCVTDTVETTIITPQLREKAQKELDAAEKGIRDTQDKLESINASNAVELTPSVLEFLKSENLL